MPHQNILYVIINVTSKYSNVRLIYRNLSAIQDREICCYSISCKEKDNIGKITALKYRFTPDIISFFDSKIIEILKAGGTIYPTNPIKVFFKLY